MKLIVGLGNIGKNYEYTRHNIGFEILDQYLGDIKWSNNQYGNYYKDKKIIFLKPSTYMNLSGNAVSYFIKYFKIDIQNVLIIHDDMDLSLGSIRLKSDSGAGGHNGIYSIIQSIGTKKFLRLKIGISRPNNNSIEHVLGKFNKSEMEILNKNTKKINSLIYDFITDLSLEELMNKYNG